MGESSTAKKGWQFVIGFYAVFVLILIVLFVSGLASFNSYRAECEREFADEGFYAGNADTERLVDACVELKEYEEEVKEELYP